jgi:bifunctional NMN adenylyltransferase/nudix hydrolase
VDPFTVAERETMIRKAIDLPSWTPEADPQQEPVFIPIRDFLYSDNDWIVQVQRAVGIAIIDSFGSDCEFEVTIYGAEKEKEKDYLRQFPQWKLHVSKAEETDIAPAVLRALFEKMDMSTHVANLKMIGGRVTPTLSLHPTTGGYLDAWITTDRGKRISEEYQYVVEYKKRTQTSKYPIQFNTVDSVAYYKGNILLVRRRSQPGRGLWALPGGFLEAYETRFSGAMRELLEETNLRVKPEWLVAQQGFDSPKRSIRGRTITEAFLWKIPNSRNVPQIKAGSDASKAQWFPLSKVLGEMNDQLFEDHLDIIETLTRRL